MKSELSWCSHFPKAYQHWSLQRRSLLGTFVGISPVSLPPHWACLYEASKDEHVASFGADSRPEKALQSKDREWICAYCSVSPNDEIVPPTYKKGFMQRGRERMSLLRRTDFWSEGLFILMTEEPVQCRVEARVLPASLPCPFLLAVQVPVRTSRALDCSSCWGWIFIGS